MTAKEYLGQSLAIERLLLAKRRLLQKLRLQSVSLSSTASADRVKSSHCGSMTTVEKIMDLEMEIARQKNALIDKQREILDRIQSVCNPTLIAVLTDRYITGMSFEEIAESMDKSVRTISVWHGQALQMFRKETGMK